MLVNYNQSVCVQTGHAKDATTPKGKGTKANQGAGNTAMTGTKAIAAKVISHLT